MLNFFSVLFIYFVIRKVQAIINGLSRCRERIQENSAHFHGKNIKHTRIEEDFNLIKVTSVKK